MYEIGDFAMLASAIFAGIGLYMAHTLYKSPRKLWQCLAAWAGIILVCTAIGEVVGLWLPQFTEQRLANFIGCGLVLAYLYVFPNIPLPQRIFSYFMLSNSMYLLVLLCRTVTMLLVYYLGAGARLTFAVCYLLAAVAFCIFYIRVLKAVILRGLAAFQQHLVSLTVFAVLSYFSLLFIVDAWEPWPALSLAGALPCFGIISINLGGYVLAFLTLGVISQRIRAERDAKLAEMQLALAEKEYHAAMQGFTQVRQLRHDMTHHFNAIGALARQQDTVGILSYLQELSALAPSQDKAVSPGNFIINSFLSHYRKLCGERGVAFSSQVTFSEEQFPNKAHLGIILGNALQNAYEAVCKQTTRDSFIEVILRRMDANLILILRNSYAGVVKEDFETTKAAEGHGIGLASMRGIAELYNGYFELDYTDEVFTVNLVLGLGGTQAAREDEYAEAGNL